MTEQIDRRTPREPEPPAATEQRGERGHLDHSPGGASPPPTGGHGGHRLMMIACCIPMLVIAAILVVTGVAGYQTILVAVACTALMAAMMGGHRH